MSDYTWPSVYFAYFFFAICFGLAVFFFVRSWKDGYWSRGGEDVKYDVFTEEEGRTEVRRRLKPAPQRPKTGASA